MKYGVALGQVYVAADGSKTGVVVVDDTTYASVDDVVVRPFTAKGYVTGNDYRIDVFKLAKVRYSLSKGMPAWFKG